MKFLQNSFEKTDFFSKSLRKNSVQFKNFYDHHEKQQESCFKGYHFKTMQGEIQEAFHFNPFPFFLTEPESRSLAVLNEQIGQIIEKIIDAFVSGNAIVENFFAHYKPFLPFFKKISQRWQTLTRYDAMVDINNHIKFTEFNTSSPGGMLKAAVVNHQVRDFLLKNNLHDTFILSPLEKVHSFENYLITLENQHGIQPETIAFLYDGHRLQLELYEMKERMKRIGRKAIVANVSELIYKNNSIYINNEKISTIYNNFFLAGESLSGARQSPWSSNQSSLLTDHPYSSFFNGILNDAALLIIGFPAMTIIEDKSIFCLLHDPCCQNLFTPDEQEFIQRHIPYSRNLDGALLDLEMNNLLNNKDQLVLKIKHSALGLGVFLGSDYSVAEWENLLRKNRDVALLQERIYGKKIPALFTNQHEVDANIVFSIYSYSGQYYGLVARISEGNITNVFSRGMYQPILMSQ